jgi:carboxymethylenebutenolidase
MERTGWSLSSHASECILKHLRAGDHPVCGTSVASRLFIGAAATPPLEASRGGESAQNEHFANSFTASKAPTTLLYFADARSITANRIHKNRGDIMKRGAVAGWCALAILLLNVSSESARRAADAEVVSRSSLPSATEVKELLNSSHHHPDWIRVPTGSASILTWVVYSDRADKAGVVIIAANDRQLSDWLRAISDQVASEGFIAVVPDVPSGATAEIDAVRNYMIKHPAANGKHADLIFSGTDRMDITVATTSGGNVSANEATLAKIKAPVLGLYGQIDARITETVEPTAAAMKGLGKVYEPHIYKDATHAFIEYQNLGENAKATADAWPRTIAFLKENTR